MCIHKIRDIRDDKSWIMVNRAHMKEILRAQSVGSISATQQGEDSMMENSKSNRNESILVRFLSGMNESVFQTVLGIANIELVDYLNHLLIRFVRTDAMKNIGISEGPPTRQFYDLLEIAGKSRGAKQRDLYQAAGDYTLFWSGIYPESLKRSPLDCGANRLADYSEQGKRCYALASRINPSGTQATQQLLQCLSDHFELCVFGLSEVRQQWESDRASSSENIIA